MQFSKSISKTLFLEGNQIQNLPSLESCDMFIKLNLNDNNLTSLDFNIGLLEDLQILSLDNNQLQQLESLEFCDMWQTN